MIKKRDYSDDFRKRMVLEIMSGQSSIVQIAKREMISRSRLAKWRDEMRLEEASPCKICDTLGQSVSADYDEGESLPEETNQLVPISDSDQEIFQCPSCGNFYQREVKVDNDIYNSIHITDFRRVNPETVKSVLKRVEQSETYDRRQISKFKKKMKSKFGAEFLETLPPDEKRVFDLLMNRGLYGQDFEKLERELGFDRAVLLPLLDGMEGKNLIRRNVNYPLRPGEHNFQEPILDVDPLEYMVVTIDYL